MVRFHFLTGDASPEVYGGKWISNRQSNGEFDYYFVIELMNWEEAVGERDAAGKPTYNLSLTVVSPQQAGEKHLESAYSCCGIEDEMLETAKKNGSLVEVQVEALHAYAGGVPVWGEDGNNWRKLFKEARKQAEISTIMFGFVMDRPVNRIGETGWEALRHADVKDVLDRVIAEHDAAKTKPSPEVQLVAKMTQ